jgi:transcriptional regulator with XRE-family HTH domain
MSTTNEHPSRPDSLAANAEAAAREAELAETRLRAALGSRIREARQQRNLSARKLAELVGVTPSWISQLERGQVTPSFATMFRINHMLGITTADLFGSRQPAEQVLLREEWLVHPFRGISDDAVLAIDPAQRVEVLWSSIPPGMDGHEPIAHKADLHFVFVLRGIVELRIEDARHVLPEHASMTFDGRVPHVWANLSDQASEILSVFAPAV